MDEGLATAGEVRDEVVTLIVAGHETVASALAWALATFTAIAVMQLCEQGRIDLDAPADISKWHRSKADEIAASAIAA